MAKPPVVYEIELRERMIRVGEELKHQRDLMKKRFEQVEKGFEQMDQRFEAITKGMDKFMIWTFGLIVGGSGLFLGILKALGL